MSEFLSYLYLKLEKEFMTSLDVDDFLKQFESPVVEEQKILWMEARLLEAKNGGLFRMWDDDVRNMTIDFCRERLAKSKNLHLRTVYSWDLWWLTGEEDNTMLAQAKEYSLQLMEEYLPRDDYDSAAEFCYFFKLLYPICCRKGGIEQLMDIVNRSLHSKNETLKFQMLAKIYWQEMADINIANNEPGTEGKEIWNLLKRLDKKYLAATCLEMAEKENDDNKLHTLLEMAVYYTSKANDRNLTREANLRMGDYIMENLAPEGDDKRCTANIRDTQLENAIACYKIAGDDKKLRNATLEYEHNKKNLVFIPNRANISVEERNRQIDAMNKQITKVLDGGEMEVLNTLFGYGITVFPDFNKTKAKVKKQAEKFYYTQFTNAVRKDEYMNSRKTTHEDMMARETVTYCYRSFSFHVFALIIENAIRKKIMTYKDLKKWLLNRGFDLYVWRNLGNGETKGATYMERVDLGLRDFVKLNSKFLKQQKADWRYCITFLATQFEGLLRDIVERLGEPVDRKKQDGSMELIPLEGLLGSEVLKDVFEERDLFLFRQTFTKSGYNIRNKVAHGMMHPDDYTELVGLLVFVSILRLSKATFKLKMIYQQSNRMPQ